MSNVDTPEINALGVCAGVGMLDEGLRAGLDFLGIRTRIVALVEREAYAAACLISRMEAQGMEPAPVWAGNLESCDVSRLHGLVDIGVAGFPCPPVSAAGSKRGVHDERWILPAILEMFRAVGAGLLFLENVSGLLSANAGREFGEVHRLLAAFGYDAEWLTLRASDVGASHQRDRVFILAFRSGRGLGILRESLGRSGQPECGGGNMEHAASCGSEGSRVPIRSRQSLEAEAIAYGGITELADPLRRDGEPRPGRERVLDGGEAMADAGGRQLPQPRRGSEGRDGSGPAGPVVDHPAGARRDATRIGTAADCEGRECVSGEGCDYVAHSEDRRRRGNGNAIEDRPEGGTATTRGSEPLGHAEHPDRRPEHQEHGETHGRPGLGRPSLDVADSQRDGSQGEPSDGPARQDDGNAGRSSGKTLFAPGPSDPRWADIIRECPWLAPALTQEEAESVVRVLPDGMAGVLDHSRSDALRAAGNGVVALQAAVSFVVLARRLLT